GAEGTGYSASHPTAVTHTHTLLGLVAMEVALDGQARSTAKDVFVDEGVAELARRVEARREGAEFGYAGVSGAQVRGGRDEELAPVRARRERGEAGFQRLGARADDGPVTLKREVQAHAVGAVIGAEPEPVGGDGADLGHDQRR